MPSESAENSVFDRGSETRFEIWLLLLLVSGHAFRRAVVQLYEETALAAVFAIRRATHRA
jgi:hypothetical protein